MESTAAQCLRCPCGGQPISVMNIASVGFEQQTRNVPLDVLERSMVDERVKEYQNKMDELTTLRQKVRDFEHSLTAQHDALEDRVRSLKWLQSPLRTFPPEILREIFLHTTIDGNKLHEDDFSIPSVILSHVCSRWRRIVLSSPDLWTKLSIRLKPTLNDVESEPDLENALSVFSRAISFLLEPLGSASLDLSVEIHEDRSDELDEEQFIRFAKLAEAIIALTLPSSKQWKSLQLHFSPDIVQIVLPLLPHKGRLTRLEHLDIDFCFNWITTPDQFFFFQDAPLQSLTWRHSLDPNLVVLPWATLKRVYLDFPDAVYKVLTALASSQSRVECLDLIDCGGFDTDEADPATDIDLHSKFLHIAVNADLDEAELLAHLQLPAVTFLKVSKRFYHINAGSESLFPTQKISHFLSRSSCTLKYFHWARLQTTVSDFICLLEHMPTLECLRLDCVWDTEVGLLPSKPFFDQLSNLKRQQMLLNLQTLLITAYVNESFPFSYSSFLAFVSTRRGPTRSANFRSLDSISLKVIGQGLHLSPNEDLSYLALLDMGVGIVREPDCPPTLEYWDEPPLIEECGAFLSP